MLGVVSHLYSHLEKKWPAISEWPQHALASMKPYHGGTFQGNECKTLLENLDFLQNLAEKHGNFEAIAFVDTFRAFNSVRKSCFGTELADNFKQALSDFRSSVLSLQMFGLSITPKIHMVIHHVEDWVTRHGQPLGQVSEQAGESVHSAFRKHMENFKVSPLNPKFGQTLLRTVVSFSSENVKVYNMKQII